jgi:transposase
MGRSVCAGGIHAKKRGGDFYAFTLPNESFDHHAIAQCLRRLLRQVRGRLIVVWDRSPIHRGPALRQLLADYPRLEIEHLPGYAPDLNPVEQLWNHLKWTRLCNYAPSNCHDLHDRLCDELILIRYDPTACAPSLTPRTCRFLQGHWLREGQKEGRCQRYNSEGYAIQSFKTGQ